MAEYIASTLQTVDSRQNVLYTDTVEHGHGCIWHREGSGVVTLKGITQCSTAKFRAMFSGNISIPTGGTVEGISLAIAVNGEPIPASEAIVTPAAVEEPFNVAVFASIEVPKSCCANVSVVNTTDQAIDVTGANLIIDRVV